MFSTLNESSLHNTLKILYSEIYDGTIEVNMDDHVYDILTKNNNVIEIQTKNLSSLYNKIKDAILKGHNVKIIHPIPINTKIKLYDKNNILIKESRSSKKGSIYDLFKEVTKLFPILLNPHFSLEIILINMTEIRTKTNEPVQSKNGRRRFKKDWIKTNKILDEIITTKKFNSSKDYLSLLPKTLPKEFCAKDLQLCLKQEKLAPARIYNNPHLIIWVLSKMSILKYEYTKNKNHYYSIV